MGHLFYTCVCAQIWTRFTYMNNVYAYTLKYNIFQTSNNPTILNRAQNMYVQVFQNNIPPNNYHFFI